jgi:hypothetical protein
MIFGPVVPIIRGKVFLATEDTENTENFNHGLTRFCSAFVYLAGFFLDVNICENPAFIHSCVRNATLFKPSKDTDFTADI